jgi:hypothetical protein
MLSLIALLSLAASAQANEIPCANMAKYAAIRAYKAEVGEVQGSDGIQYSAVATATRGNYISYLVTISENNEDGESWEVGYNVNLLWQQNAKPECKILSVKKQ